jgi:histidinol phosphatase-like PHP family hydrolase
MTSPFATNPRDIDKTTIPSIDFHLHTNWTDGEDSITVVYQAAVDAGLNTILFSEHGRRTSVDWFPDFAEKIRDLPMEPCRALVGVESKIEDREGNLDVADEMVNAADLVMASVHRFPGLDGTPIPFEEMDTNDVVELEFQLSWAALSNPVIDILGHPFGMSLRRFGVEPPEDKLRALMERSATFGVMFEINSYYHPDPWRLIKMCREAGTDISLGSNAHAAKDVGNIVRTLKGKAAL